MKNPFYEILKIYLVVVAMYFSCTSAYAVPSDTVREIISSSTNVVAKIHYSSTSTIVFLVLGSIFHFYRSWRKMQLSDKKSGLPSINPSVIYWIKDNSPNIIIYMIGTFAINYFNLDLSPQSAFLIGYGGNSFIDWMQKELESKKVATHNE